MAGIGLDLEDRVIVVTGAARGMGELYARELLAAGARVVATDVTGLDAVEDAASQSGGEDRLLVRQADVSSRADTDALAAAALDAWGHIDGLVNNAAMYAGLTRLPGHELPESEWDRVMDVNVKGVWNATSSVLPAMRSAGAGKVVNISSSVILKGTPNFLHYVASKGAVWAMTRSLARENGAFGVHVNSVTPGLVSNEATKGNWEEDRFTQFVAARVAERAVQREMVPSDLVGAVLFLLSPASDFITGQNINVDGGADFY